MTHEEIQDQYELYVMGAADPAGREEIRAHLAEGCEVCTESVRRARLLASYLGTWADSRVPPPKLRRRILAAAGYERPGIGWALLAAVAAAALCLVGAVYFNGRARGVARELARLREEARQQTIELTRVNEILSIIAGPATTEASFGQGPKGRVYLNPRQGVVLVASNLPPASPGKAYEMWVIPKGGKPVPAGTFQSAPDGAAIHLQPGPVDPAATAAVAVTLEQETGAAQPTSAPLLVAELR